MYKPGINLTLSSLHQNKSLSLSAADQEALQMDLEQFQNFASTFSLTSQRSLTLIYLSFLLISKHTHNIIFLPSHLIKFRCNARNIKEIYNLVLYSKCTSIRWWQFVEAVVRIHIHTKIVPILFAISLSRFSHCTPLSLLA